MKMTKRILSLALCLVLCLSLALPAMASSGPYTLTINNDAVGHTYEAYQIFSGDLVTTTEGKDVLSNVKWGSSISNTAGLMTALETAFPGLLVKGVDGNRLYVGAAGVAEYLSNNVTSDSESIDLFAEVVSKYLGAAAGTSEKKDGSGNVLPAAPPYSIGNLSAGYYLIKDRDDSLENANDVYTKSIIRVLKNETVTAKSSVPEIDKTINDTVDGTFSESEDFDIGDTAYYKWSATLPSNLMSYDIYTYNFVDTLPKGLKFIRWEQVYIEGHDGNNVHSFYNVENDTAYLADPGHVAQALPTGITQEVVENADLTTVAKMNFADLFTLYPNILETHKVVVKYSCLVTRDAKVVDPMTNKVYAQFSNNPNGEGTGDLGKTPDDVAHAFTFKITVDKYDADDSSKKLPGAEFVLYYTRIVDEHPTNYYAKVVTEEMVYEADADGNLTTTLKPESERVLPGSANTTPIDADDIGVVYGWTTVKSEASVLDTDHNGALTVKGLDSGLYYLEETKAPAGYNLMETPVRINIIAVYNKETGLKESLTYEVDSISQGSSSTVGVRNSSGSTLPVTGGAGTTMIYVAGVALIAAAVVLMISKKRRAEG